MTVICANCGEELLGAVNRCWRCGKVVVSTPDAGEAPPIRRQPVDLRAPLRPDVPPRIEEATGEPTLEVEIVHVAGEESSGPPVPEAAASGDAPPDSGSESAAGSRAAPSSSPASKTATDESSDAPLAAPRTADYRPRGLADVAAVLTVILGLATIGLGLLSGWALLLGILGLSAGIWALRSRWKSLAVVGLLLCCLGMTVCGVRVAYDAFTWWFGEPPLESGADPADELPDVLE